MKTKLQLILLALLSQIFFSSSVFGATLVSEGFDSSIDGWNVSNSSNVYHHVNSGNGFLFIDREDSAEKTFNLGSTYANQTVTVSMNWWAPNDWESSGDYLQVRINNSEDHNDNNGGGYVNHTFSTTADGSGNITLYISPRTSQNSEDAYIDSITIETQDPVFSCPGETIFADPLTSSDTHTIPDGTIINAYDSHYYTFTSQIDGVFRAKFDADYSNRGVNMYITQGCSGSHLGSSPYTNNGDKDSGDIEVSAGVQVVVQIYRDYSKNMQYGIDFTFTASVATANDDSFSVLPNNTLNDNVLDNDKGPDITITSNTDPSHGTLSLNTDGTFTYTPDTDFEGTDTFTYNIEDSNGATSSATVTISVALSTNYDGFHAFERVNPENTRYVRGNYAIAGNTVTCLTALTSGYADASDICHGQTDYTNLTSNKRVNKYLDIDGDSSTWNSTSSYVVLPDTYDPAANRGVLWAGLFWQGRISNNNDYSKHYAKVNGSSYDYTETKGASSIILENTNANKIKLKINSGSYLDVQASTVYKEESNGDVTYAAYADVTSKIKAANLIAGKQVFTVANLTTEVGREGSPGLFGGWSLVVIYAEDLYGEVRNISVLSGFDKVRNPSAAFPITGLKLPKTGTVNASLSLFAGEGETLYKTDWVKISGDGSSYDYMPGAVDDDNIFDGVFTGIGRDTIPGKYNDLALNNNGVDVDTFDVSAQVQQYRDDNPNLNTLYMQWYSNNDYITPSMIAFATQLYEPKLCYDYSIKQDGHYLKLDRTTSTIASVTGRISSSPLEIEVYLRNEEADLPAEGVSFRTDVNTTMFNQVGDLYTSNIDGSVLFDRGTPQFTSPLCDYNLSGDNSVDNVGCTDGHNIRKGNGILDAYDYVYTKFLLQPNISGLSDINESLGLSIDYYITASGFTIPYLNYIIGGPNVPICPPSDAYIPEFGQFNVVSSASIYNNLNTQISRKPFDVDVIFDSDPSTGVNDAPTSDLNSTVLVEIIDVDAFGDLNASCANPDAAVSAWPVFVPLQYTPSHWQTQVPPQPSSFFNFATQNATYRVWYFDDDNGTLIENWTANTANNGKDLLSISGLYNSSVHTVCAAACSDDTNVGCFTCIRDNYAKPLCARDNFSVRPESYDMRVYDINNSLPTYNIVADPTNLKNLTKVDLSTLHNQIPSQPIANGTPLELAAGYDYRYDVNATGYDSLNGVPGYTREFTTNSDYNVTMYWNGPNGTFCNDTSDLSLSFYIANGVLMNQEEQHTNVGDYFVNIIDRTWTIVDWDSSLMTHHLNGGFNPIQAFDCDTTSSTTVTNGLHGCTITSNQPTAGSGIYRDVPLTFHPYMFDITNTLSVGPENKPLSDKSFVYMNNIDNDENMSVHLNSFVTARGLSNANALTNFVAGCYATDVNFTIGKSTTTANNIAYRYISHDLNATGDRIVGADLNGTIAAGNTTGNPLLLVPATYWNKNMNGVLNLETNLNFNRAVNIAVNPEDINFTTLQADDNVTL
ncbi:MAG: Ig-like domain-containing protein, partial [Campylobacterales bacterium]|nr:Ig-like domain-containing protein [Campylobacterales bacterium]